MTLLTDDLRALVGTTVSYTAPEELGRASIRYFARAVGDDNPLYTDEKFASEHGLDSVIAPPTLICETNQYADLPRAESGYAGHEWKLEIPGTNQYRGGNRYEFLTDVRPSDIITAVWTLADLAERVTSSGSSLVTATSQTRFSNQRDVLLAVNTETIIFVERRDQS